MAQQHSGNIGTRPGGRAQAAARGSGGIQASGATAPPEPVTPAVPARRAIPRGGDPAGTVVPAVCAERKKS